MSKQYFYNDGETQFGPFSLEDISKKPIKKNTPIWYKGLDDWTEAKKLKELDFIFQSDNKNSSFKKYNIIAVIGVIFFIGFFGFLIINNNQSGELKLIRESAYESDTDFDFYVDKFYRDLEFFGLYPVKPKTTIIKLAHLDKVENLTHYHGVSLGFEKDNKIEIYINGSTWIKLTKPMRYWLMYHELAHDVLNVDDLKVIEANEGKLMYPEFSKYEGKSMDDFIESYKTLFRDKSGLSDSKITNEKNKDFVVIKDKNFEKKLIELKLDNKLDGKLNYENAQKITEIDLYVSNIQDLTGIEAMTNLKVLYFSGNPISKVDLSSNINLEELNCGGCELENLDLSNNKKLNRLYCSNNKLKTLVIKNNANITYLDCGNNMIQELNIEKNKNLKTLYCDNNNFDCKALKAKLSAVPVDEDIIDAAEALQLIQ